MHQHHHLIASELAADRRRELLDDARSHRRAVHHTVRFERTRRFLRRA